ncbi:hypothetical protein Tco_1455059 [Tanacetum coccineum]
MISNIEPPKLPIHTILNHHQHHHDEPLSGMLTPPLQTTTATVPFRWEEQPGKPRPCTDMIIVPQQQKCLELPPRLTKIESKTLSPTTVLDGPSDLKGSSKNLLSSSFRVSKERRRLEGRHKSFDSCDGWSTPVEDNNGQHVMLLGGGGSAKGIFGSFRFKGNSDTKHKVKGSSVISPLSTMDNIFFEEKKGKRFRRNSSLSKVTRSHFWVSSFFSTSYFGV